MAKTPHAETETSDARSRLVSAALRLFARKATKAPPPARSARRRRQHFGDPLLLRRQSGLYRAAFTEPMGESPCGANIAEYADLPLPEVLHRFFAEFLEPLKKGEELGLVMKLHFREMIEPTGAWQQEIEAEIKPQHDGWWYC